MRYVLLLILVVFVAIADKPKAAYAFVSIKKQEAKQIFPYYDTHYKDGDLLATQFIILQRLSFSDDNPTKKDINDGLASK